MNQYIKPVLVHVTVGLFITGLYLLYRRYKISRDRRNQTNSDHEKLLRLAQLKSKLKKLLESLDKIPAEDPDNEDNECVVCTAAKVAVQTFPCRHKVLCRKCFVRTIQTAVEDLNLPLRCVMCREKILTLDQSVAASSGSTPLPGHSVL